MINISLESSARLSEVSFESSTEGHSVDIAYRSGGKILAGTYRWDEVKQFVRELAEALGMTLEETAPEIEPIVLPKDVYEEVAEMKESLDGAEDAQEARARADRKIWKSCRANPNDTAIANWIDTTDGATIDLAKMLMGELPFKCEREPVIVLKNPKMQYLEKAHLNTTGGWSIKFTADIENAIKFPSRYRAADFAETLSYMTYLSVKEV